MRHEIEQEAVAESCVVAVEGAFGWLVLEEIESDVTQDGGAFGAIADSQARNPLAAVGDAMLTKCCRHPRVDTGAADCPQGPR